MMERARCMRGFLLKTIGGRNYRVYRGIKCEHEMEAEEYEPQTIEPSSSDAWQSSFDSREASIEKDTGERSPLYHSSIGELE
jgi:hypothetical protein